MKLNLSWTVGHSLSKDTRPNKMVTAGVPGNANLDWIIANDLPDWKFGVNYTQYKWMEDCWWLYEAVLPDVPLDAGETMHFVSKGIDYEYIIMLDGRVLCTHEGMFSGVDIPLTNPVGGLLQIWVAPPPKDPLGLKDTREEAATSCKPAVSYGWDWHPRLIPSGMWEDAYIEIRKSSYFTDARPVYVLADDFSTAALSFIADITGGGKALLTLFDPDGQPLFTMDGGESKTLENPRLWWCNGYGEPDLYRWEAILTLDGNDVDKASGAIGFRKVELTMNEGAWDVPIGFPISRSPTPITISLNDVPIFAKGSNWVNPEVFTGTITKDTYVPLINLAVEANFNILRCWGGAIINKKAFFDLCDEQGIMIWQDFPLACNNYQGTPQYLTILAQEAESIITRLKDHPCLVLWCGGNELFNNWSKMTDQSLALRLLNKLCYELDPGRPFIMTSPIDGMAHGCYLFRYPDGREVYQSMPTAKATAYAEFGVPSFSNINSCEMAASKADIFPMQINDVTIAHHAFKAWGKTDYPWGCLDIIEDYFGEPQSLEDLIDKSQWLQGEGYKCIFEEARRQKPFCSMALNWCFNDTWPALANNSLICYPAEPKVSYYDVSDSCRSVLISARIPKFVWYGGETFYVDLWLLADGNETVAAGITEVSVEINGVSYPMQSWNYNGVPANVNLEGPTVRLRLPYHVDDSTERRDCKSGFYEMKLVIDAGELSSSYRLLYKNADAESLPDLHL